MDRCDKCNGFLVVDGDEYRCFNCGKRFYKKDALFEMKTVICIKCGKPFLSPTKARRICSNCKKKSYIRKINCVVCGREFIAKSPRTSKCRICRKLNRNEEYLKQVKAKIHMRINNMKNKKCAL